MVQPSTYLMDCLTLLRNTKRTSYFLIFHIVLIIGLSDFIMGTILGKGFAQAQVHIFNSTSAEGTSAFDNMYTSRHK